MSDGGVKMGLPRQLATHLAAQTVMVCVSNIHTTVVRKKIRISVVGRCSNGFEK